MGDTLTRTPYKLHSEQNWTVLLECQTVHLILINDSKKCTNLKQIK